MGDIADMMLDGTLCSGCGEYLGQTDGYPVACASCAKDEPAPTPDPGAGIVWCQPCNGTAKLDNGEWCVTCYKTGVQNWNELKPSLQVIARKRVPRRRKRHRRFLRHDG